ncbi:hypothetical protein, no similarity [Maudiozyma saulgeensis]|uniref:Uncharacterized protein n=1 Tax=Maudiozyma saulgeensis TaxID=1789683 RepID=A0A1X7RB89_9SACH|nr:hypothetical protein, no similarity [Kazachstania saulgeensis]
MFKLQTPIIQNLSQQPIQNNMDSQVQFSFLKDEELIQIHADCKKLTQSGILKEILDSTDGTVCVYLPKWDMDEYQDIIGLYLMWYNQSHKSNTISHVNITSSILPDKMNDIVNAVYGTQMFTYYQHKNFCVLHNAPEKLLPNVKIYMDSTTNKSNEGLIRFMQLKFWNEYLKDWVKQFNVAMTFMSKDKCFLMGNFEDDEENEERKNLFECYDWAFYHLLAFLSRISMLYALLQPNLKGSKEPKMIMDLYQNTLEALHDKEDFVLDFVKEYKDMRREIDRKKIAF